MELQATKEQKNWSLRLEFGHRIDWFGHRICCQFSALATWFFGHRIAIDRPPNWQIRQHVFDDSATDFWSSVADFDRLINIRLRFRNKGSRILRPKAYFGAEALQIWWATIILIVNHPIHVWILLFMLVISYFSYE